MENKNFHESELEPRQVSSSRMHGGKPAGGSGLSAPSGTPLHSQQLKGGALKMAQDMEPQFGSYWESRIECVTAVSQWALAKRINDLYPGKFVVGTQTFAPRMNENLWTAFVYYKVKRTQRAEANGHQG